MPAALWRQSAGWRLVIAAQHLFRKPRLAAVAAAAGSNRIKRNAAGGNAYRPEANVNRVATEGA